MIDELNNFTRQALQAAGEFKNIVTTTDQKFADFDATRPAACWAIKPLNIVNLNLEGDHIQLPIRILILISDHNQQRGTEKMISLHNQFTGKFVQFGQPDKYIQEDMFVLAEDSPSVLVNTKDEYTLGIEYQGKITVYT